MLVDTALLAQDLEDCREFINLILYLLEQKNLEQYFLKNFEISVTFKHSKE